MDGNREARWKELKIIECITAIHYRPRGRINIGRPERRLLGM
jgi:hypothetical protein